MKSDKTDKIIEFVYNNDVSERIKLIFRRWLVSSDDQEGKERALSGLWDSISATTSREECESRLGKLHVKIEVQGVEINVWRTLRKIVAVVILAMTVYGGGYLTSEVVRVDCKEFHLVTASKSKGEFLLPDSTKVWLNANSSLTYDSNFAQNNRDVKLEGEAFFEVKRDEQMAFKVQMDRIEVEVLGTSFDARSYKHGATEEVVLVKGVVKILGDRVNPIILRPHEKFTFNRNNAISTVETVVSHNYTTWFGEQLTFENTSLKDVFSQLERWYNIDIVADAAVDTGIRVSLKVGYESVDDILRVLATINDLKYDVASNKIVVTNAK